ncbi:MAG: zinc-dependent metalloprotease [Candidatus Polarisedimenticolia bacterium]
MIRASRPTPLIVSLILAAALLTGAALPLTAAPTAGPAGPSEGIDARRKKDAGAAKEGKAKSDGEKKDDKDQPKEPPFEKAVKEAKEIQGLFNVYYKEDEGKYLLEIAPSQFDAPFLLNPTLVSGLGEFFVYPADMLPEYVVSFHRVGRNVQLIHRNALFTADASSSMGRPSGVAAPDAIVGQSKIESLPHPDRKSILIDLGAIVVNDLEGAGLLLKRVLETPWGLDKDGSSISFARGYPSNVDFETVLHFRTPEVKRPLTYAADPRSVLIRFHYSLARLPETGYRPRLADDRVGHFLAMMKDYTDDRPEEATRRYVTRWHLEQKDPAAPVSEPKEPIVFHLENSIPPQYRPAVRDGILGWNPAFERIGFRNAIVVKEQPEDPDWDAADVRHSTIRWIVAPNAGFAQGPSRINPYTGQIFDADIRFSLDMIRNIRHEYEELVSPVAQAALLGGRVDASSPLRRLAGWTSMLGPLPLETLLAAGGEAAALPVLGAGRRPGMTAAAMGYCDYAMGLSQQAALGWSLLQARGRLDEAAQDRYINDFILHVTLHEVGHTLGLRHNFRASSIRPFARLQDKALTGRDGMTGSVMDYIPVNLAPEGQAQGDYWQTVVGPYDLWAIEYAYTPIAAGSIEAERPELEKIAARSSDPMLAYGTDEDDFSFSPRGIDPTTNKYDNGGDILAYYTTRAAIARELFGKIESELQQPGKRYQTLRRVFAQGIGELVPAAGNVPKFIGGIRHYRDHIGDPEGRVPYNPVPAPEQRAALAFLTREIFGPEAFVFPPSLLNKLAIERHPDIEGVYWTIERNDPPIHNVVLTIQSLPIDRMYHPISLARLHDLETRYPSRAEAFTMAEMFQAVRRAVWDEVAGRRTVNSFRRNLQRKHLQTLIDLAVGLEPGTPEDARTLARADLIALRRGIDSLVGTGGRPLPAGARLDAISVAHLDETRARITAALDAGLERRMPSPRPQG